MSSFDDDFYQNVLTNFHFSDLQNLLTTFGCNEKGQKKELVDRVVDLLIKKPPNLDQELFLLKICEIHQSMQNENNVSNNSSMMSIMLRQRIMDLKQQPIAVLPNPVYGTNPYDTGIKNSFISHQYQANIRISKLPFFEVLAECIKPTILHGSDKCTLSTATEGMKEAVFIFAMKPSHVNYIVLDRNVSNGIAEYINQLQMRICLLKDGSTETTDFMPLGLHIRIGNENCPLPPSLPITNSRTARPINCTEILKLNPILVQKITVNWCPDGQTYVFALHVVRKLTSETLLMKLEKKAAKSSYETKNVIIRKLADVDSNLTTTPYRVSLMCPLGQTRMKLPAKSVMCDHLQCFDARTFILRNEQQPTWMCPICNKPCLYDDIQLETYFLEIVTSPNLTDCCEDIELLSDGTWRVFEKNNELNNSVDSIEKPIDSVTLGDSDDDDNPTGFKKEISRFVKKECENLISNFIDLNLNINENETTRKAEQENEAQAVEVAQPITTVVDTTSQVQLQQAETSSMPGALISN